MVVDLGSQWRTRNVETILVNDPWLKGRSDSMVRSPVVECTKGLWVKDLWDAHTGDWNASIVDHLFNAQEATLIKSMPKFHSLEDNKLC